MTSWRCYDLSDPHASKPNGNWLRAGAIVSSASANPPGIGFQSAVRCAEKAPGGRGKCLDFLLLRRIDVPSEIHSECRRCGAKAQVIHWRKTPWDLSDWTGYQLDEVNVRLTAAEYELLAGCTTLDRSSQIAVFRARPEAAMIRVRATLEQALHLQDRLAAETTLETDARRQARLHRIYAKVESAIPVFRQFSPNGPRYTLETRSPPTSVFGIIDRLESKAKDLLSSSGDTAYRPDSLENQTDWTRLKERLAQEPLPELSGLSLRELSRVMWHPRCDATLRLKTNTSAERLVARCPAVVYARAILSHGMPRMLERAAHLGARPESASTISSPDAMQVVSSIACRFRSRHEQEHASRYLLCLGEFLREEGLVGEDRSALPVGRDIAKQGSPIELYWILMLKTFREIEERLVAAADIRRRYRLGPLWLYLLKSGGSEELDSIRFTRSMTAFARLMAPELPELCVERIWVGFGLPALVALGLIQLRVPHRKRPAGIRASRLLEHGVQFEDAEATSLAKPD